MTRRLCLQHLIVSYLSSYKSNIEIVIKLGSKLVINKLFTSYSIRQFYKWWISHIGVGTYYTDMSSDQELDPDQLPRGQTPIWIQPPEGASQIEMMERVIKIPELEQYNNNVTVLYDYKDDEVMDMCSKRGYKYIDRLNMTGLEDQVVILLNTLVRPEAITRGINMLIIVSRNDR